MPKHLITSALPYVNGVKHLGNLVGSMLPADVHARFLRLQGEEVLYICATDEHGTPSEVAAEAAGLPVDVFCAQQWAIQKDVGERFGLSWDYFGRSSSPENHALTKHFAAQLEANGYIDERETQQIYSVSDGRFLPDRYVIGTCPHCGYPRARGDQCENCTRLLDPDDLIDPRSTISGATDLELRATRHLYLLQSKLADKVRAWIDTKNDWPTLTRSIAYKWLDEGLEDRSITRDLSWGVPVDRPGFEHKVFYVWFDAPIEYLGATNEWADAAPGRDWRSWWYDTGDNVVYTQFMAKDNVPFHTVFFPCTLIGSGEPWKLPDFIKAFNWLTYYGGKFSTSDQRGVFMDAALEILPADYWRYHLMSNAPESDDSSFTWESLAVSVNNELANSYGNFVNRCLSFVASRSDGVVPDGDDDAIRASEFAADVARRVGEYTDVLARKEYRKALNELRGLWSAGNAFWEHNEPWKMEKGSLELRTTMRTVVHYVRLLAILSSPIIPFSSETVLAQYGETVAGSHWPVDIRTELTRIAAGAPIAPPGVLFRKLEDTEIEAWKERFGAGES
ncbi:MAG TPA: methionine--tRNA ligase [Acidimicrobiia bacterium]|nr:methionine--tRNA ligase [Acidimicrobiia bacterium]